MENKKNTVIYLTLVVFCIYHTQASANDVGQDVTQRQEQRDEALKKQMQPEAHVVLEQGLLKSDVNSLSYLKSHSEAICFDIKSISLEGDEAKKFQYALKPILHGEHRLIGRCIGIQGLNQALDLVQNKIFSRGYVTTRVLLAQQNIASGNVILSIIPGRVNQVKFTQQTSNRAHYFNALPVNAGDVLNIRALEQGLENFKRLPTVETDFKIQPAEQNNAPGYSDIILAWQQVKPYRLHLGVDDAGSKSTGKYQGTATVSLDHLLTLNDMFYVSYNHDLGGGNSGKRNTNGIYTSYSVPYRYWLLSGSYSQSNYLQTVAGNNQSYEYRGKSELVSVDLSRLLYRNTQRKISMSMGAWSRNSRNYIEDVEIEVQRRKTSGWKASFDYSEYLPKATFNGNLTYKRGTGAFSALAAPEENFGEAYTRVGILQANASLQVPFQVGQQRLQYLAKWRMQRSEKALTVQDRFSIGNRYTVRGYDGEQLLMADNGFLVRNELSGSILQSLHSWYAGVDYGEVGGATAYYPNPLPGTSLLGSVLGLRGQFKSFNYDVFIAAPLDKPRNFKTDDYSSGFSLNWSY